MSVCLRHVPTVFSFLLVLPSTNSFYFLPRVLQSRFHQVPRFCSRPPPTHGALQTNETPNQTSVPPVKLNPPTGTCYCLAPPPGLHPCSNTYYHPDTRTFFLLLKHAMLSAFQDNCLGCGFCPHFVFLKPSQNFLIFFGLWL